MQQLLKTFIIFVTFVTYSFAGEVFQYSTITALMEGVYDGDYPARELEDSSLIGLGTFNALDGEMVIMDGLVYQVNVEGEVIPVSPDTKTPFAVAAVFEPKAEDKAEGVDCSLLLEKTAELARSRNALLAYSIEGVFEHVKTRSVPAQKKPYPRLVDAVAEQRFFEFNDVKGRMVGFRFPEYMDGVNVPGFHTHFLNEKRTGGGHLVDCTVKEAYISVMEADVFTLIIPGSEDFGGYTSEGSEGELEAIEVR